MHNGKRNYRLGGQKKLFNVPAESVQKYEKTIKVPSEMLSEWNRLLQRDDKIKISRTQSVTPYKLTFAFRGYASIETINKVNRYFEISRKDFKIKVA